MLQDFALLRMLCLYRSICLHENWDSISTHFISSLCKTFHSCCIIYRSRNFSTSRQIIKTGTWQRLDFIVDKLLLPQIFYRLQFLHQCFLPLASAIKEVLITVCLSYILQSTSLSWKPFLISLSTCTFILK